jgi:TolB-like protein/tetratricopeptide (TPR) repeat protein
LAILIVSILGILFWINQEEKTTQSNLPKSIALLPFKNNSNDSTNEYFMNGLMGAILHNFQKIEDIEIISGTTVEKFGGISKTISEMSKELNVSYFIEGSGQKVDNEVLLTIQLIEGSTGKQLWSKRYLREIEDVFELQMDVAKSIASEINVIITPEEQKRIEKIPTQNLVAYDYYLKGMSLLSDESGAGLSESIEQFKKAIQEDGQFVNAYAYMAVSYYYLDIYQVEKKYTDEIKNYADKAIMLDENLGDSQIAKALYFMQIKDYEQAISSFEKVLVYYPNAGWIHNFLSNIYAFTLPDTEKYLRHALKGIQSAVASKDSVTASYSYLHLSNALAQTGFINESEFYVQKSLTYNPNNLYSKHLYVFIKQVKNFDLERAKTELMEILAIDSTRLDVIQEIAKVNYVLEDYKEAWLYYDKFITAKEALKLDIYPNQDINISFVLAQLGKKQEAKVYSDRFLEFAENDTSIYKDMHLSAYFASMGNIEKAISHLKAFSEFDNYQYWIILFLEDDPILKKMASHPEFKTIIQKIEDKFWNNHEKIKKMLTDENIIIPQNISL